MDQPTTPGTLEIERTELSLERTREACERTLMSWIRTSLAMMSFGFGTFKLFQYIAPDAPDAGALQWLTWALVVWGTLLLVGGIVQYTSTMRRLRREYGMPRATRLVLIGASGIAAFGAVAITELLLSM